MRIIFSGGGTGGHIFPAISVADELKKRNPGATFHFVGALGKMEMDKVPKAGYPITGLWISGFQRQLTWKNLLFPVKLAWSLAHAGWLVMRFKPDCVVGFGGYASGAALFMASLFGRRTMIQEQNSFPGVTNRILAKRVDKICVAYDAAKRFFPSDKTILTGNPVRSSLLHLPTKEEALRHFGMSADKKTVLITGGSGGARSLNEGMSHGFEVLSVMKDVQFLWQCGNVYMEKFVGSDSAQLTHVKLVPFIDRMDLAYAMADLVVCRAGALTIAELCVLGKPVVLVPSPNVAEDHQTKNAEALSERKSAVLLPDDRCRTELISKITQLLEDQGTMTSLRNNILKLGTPSAVEAIADEVERLISDDGKNRT
jgi:UDP-N-acetylglucosamine--N-acetylmuramyl-(pentapeptide) pyrophosphoryl-undecaprenol N-acetylglucosamine transferase